MIYDKENIQIAELCPIQFAEPKEVSFYPMQIEYLPKIQQTIKCQVLVSEAVSEDTMSFSIKDVNGLLISSTMFNIIELSDGIYYAYAEFDGESISEIKNQAVYFEIFSDSFGDILAESVLYEINPAYTDDLKYITYSHSENDFNMIFSDNDNDYEFTIWFECGFIP